MPPEDMHYNYQKIKVFTPQDLDALCREAERSPRHRIQRCFHTEKSDLMQRMVMAIMKGSYFQPHRHLTPPKEEIFVHLQGQIVIVTFTEAGDIKTATRLGDNYDRVVELAPGEYHSLVAEVDNTVVWETKRGPWESVAMDKQFAPFAPEEGSAHAPEYFARLQMKVAMLLG